MKVDEYIVNNQHRFDTHADFNKEVKKLLNGLNAYPELNKHQIRFFTSVSNTLEAKEPFTFIGYIILNSTNKPYENSIKAGRKNTIDNFLIHSQFGNWDVAKNTGHKCKKVKVSIDFL